MRISQLHHSKSTAHHHIGCMHLDFKSTIKIGLLNNKNRKINPERTLV